MYYGPLKYASQYNGCEPHIVLAMRHHLIGTRDPATQLPKPQYFSGACTGSYWREDNWSI